MIQRNHTSLTPTKYTAPKQQGHINAQNISQIATSFPPSPSPSLRHLLPPPPITHPLPGILSPHPFFCFFPSSFAFSIACFSPNPVSPLSALFTPSLETKSPTPPNKPSDLNCPETPVLTPSWTASTEELPVSLVLSSWSVGRG